jgi:hypothetical protein
MNMLRKVFLAAIVAALMMASCAAPRYHGSGGCPYKRGMVGY